MKLSMFYSDIQCMSLCMRGRYEVHALSNAGARGEAVKPNQELSVVSNATAVSSG